MNAPEHTCEQHVKTRRGPNRCGTPDGVQSVRHGCHYPQFKLRLVLRDLLGRAYRARLRAELQRRIRFELHDEE